MITLEGEANLRLRAWKKAIDARTSSVTTSI
jgi:hypothetical protein